MQISKLRAYLRQHPEAGSADWVSLRKTFRENRRRLFGVPRLRETFGVLPLRETLRQMFDWSPEVAATLDMLRAAKGDGDLARAFVLATEFLGHEPDALLQPLEARVRLRQEVNTARGG